MKLEAIPPSDGRMHRHPHYMLAMRRMGADVAVLPWGIALRRQIGPLRVTWMPEPWALPGLADCRKDQKGPVLLAAATPSDDTSLAGTGAIRVMTPQASAILDISQDPELLRAGLHQKWRNRLHRAERGPLRISDAPLPEQADHWIFAREAELKRQRRYRALPPAFALSWPETRLFTARLGHQPVAALLLLLHHPGATYHIGWSGTEGRAEAAHNLLVWHAAAWLQERGYSRLSLGSLDTVTAPGLAHFKLGTGARVDRGGHCWLMSRLTAPLGRLIS